jgi:hypothetical protein
MITVRRVLPSTRRVILSREDSGNIAAPITIDFDDDGVAVVCQETAERLQAAGLAAIKHEKANKWVS